MHRTSCEQSTAQNMATISIYDATISDLTAAMKAGTVTSEEIVQTFLDRIKAYDQKGPELNAIVYLNPQALEEARALDKEREGKGFGGPLHGIPILLKDNIDVAGWPTHGGCIALRGLVAERDAVVVSRLRAAGALLLGKTSMHELAAGTTTVSSDHGRTRNPYDPKRIPGGSSGGTAAAVAARFACVGLGTDTCGSIRLPAAHCALVGLRPTENRTPMRGVLPLCLTQDTVGAIARRAGDLAIVLDVIMNEPLQGQFSEKLLNRRKLDGIRLGRFVNLFSGENEDPEVAKLVNAALKQMSKRKAEIIDLDAPEIVALFDNSYEVLSGEMRNNINSYLSEHSTAPLKSLEELYETGRIHPEVEPVIKAATYKKVEVGGSYLRGIQARTRLHSALVSALNQANLQYLVYPTIVQTAVLVGEEHSVGNAFASANSGLPAITIPVGFTKAGLPVGMELLGRPDSDLDLVMMADWLGNLFGLAPLPRSSPSLAGK